MNVEISFYIKSFRLISLNVFLSLIIIFVFLLRTFLSIQQLSKNFSSFNLILIFIWIQLPYSFSFFLPLAIYILLHYSIRLIHTFIHSFILRLYTFYYHLHEIISRNEFKFSSIRSLINSHFI